MKSVVGMKDNYGSNAKTLRFLENTLLELSKVYGFQEFRTPIVEYAEVFTRSLGESSDVVSKEMFTFPDKNGDLLTLRPENTAGIMRAIFSEGLLQQLPLKLFYAGPMFRYESPQKGRYRQFNQLGVEVLGLNTPQADVELIALAWDFICKLSLQKDCVLEINSLGDKISREAYKEALGKFLSSKKDLLSKDSQDRLNKNILRILDSKDENDQKLLSEAPNLKDYLSEESKAWFAAVQEGLSSLSIPFKVNDKLVRGLDYYSETVFEITTDKIGSQSAVLAGGRYNDLAKQMGGVEFSGVGFAAGAERLALMVPPIEEIKPDVALVSLNDKESIAYGLKVAQEIRKQGLIVEIPYNESLNKKMKKADKIGATWAIVIGENERKTGRLTIKNLKLGKQEYLTLEDFLRKVL